MFGRYGFRNLTTEDQPNIPLPSGGAGNGHIYARNRQFVFGTTWVPSANSLLEARIGYSWTQGGKNPPALGSDSASAQFGLSGLPSDSRIAGGLPTQLITGFSDLGRQATNPQWQYPTVYNPKVNYTWTTGVHSFKTGYEFQHIDTEVQDVNPLYGRDTYNGQFTRPAGVASNNLYNLTDFMLGLRAQYALSSVLVAQLRRDMHFAYVQDDWRATSRLTLNLGVRYEVLDAVLGKRQRPFEFRPGDELDGPREGRLGLRPRAHQSGPEQLRTTPRLCVHHYAGDGHSGRVRCELRAFQPRGRRRRAAYQRPASGQRRREPDRARGADIRDGGAGYPAGLADPSQFNPLTANITYMPKDFHSSPVQSWHISLQRELLHNMLLDVAYVGNRASSLLLFANYNQAAPNNSAGSIPLQDRRPIPSYSDITYPFNGGKSRYKALQAKLDWRMSRDLTLLSSLTLSKTKDNGSQSLENSNGNNPSPQDFRNLGADFGVSNYDQPYNSTTSFVWGLPFGKGQRWASKASPALDALIGGWQVAGINSVFAGEPVTFIYNPGATFIVSGIAQDFTGSEQLPAERDVRSDGIGGGADDQ